MSLSTKILLIVMGVLLFGSMSFIIYMQVQNSNRQAAIETSMIAQRDLIDGIVRSQSQWTTKADMEKFITDNGVNLKAIQDDMDKLNAQVTAVNVIVSASNGQHGTNVPSTGPGNTNPNPTVPTCPDGTVCPNADPFGYMKTEQTLALNEDFGKVKVPFGKVGFSAWQKAPWSVDINPREYHVASVIGTDENQRLSVYNKFTMKVDGKDYEVPIKTAITQQVYPDAKFSFWNPKLFITTGGGINVTSLPVNGTFNAGGTFGFISYGKYKTTPAISLLQVGAGYSSNKNEFAVIVNPVNVNIGGIFPAGVVSNTYVGPSVQITPSGSVFVGANLSIGL